MNKIEAIIQSIEAEITAETGSSIGFIQKTILREPLLETRKTYAEIARETSYSETYIKQWVASRLWKLLSSAIGEKVNKTNCHALFTCIPSLD
jgi:hypothetical protein